jgi:hypothetical protein
VKKLSNIKKERGMTADAATRAIRKIDPDGSVGLISMEPVPPCDRPPLSKKLWKGQPLAGIWRKTESLGWSFISDGL